MMLGVEDEVSRYKACLLRTQNGWGNSPWENGFIFSGRKAQRGFGFGSFLKSVGKIALPLVKTLGKSVLKTALGVGQDILEGKKVKESLKTRGKGLVKDTLKRAGGNLQQSGSGKRKYGIRSLSRGRFNKATEWLEPYRKKRRLRK